VKGEGDPRRSIVDAEGRPYFLWDVQMTLTDFKERLAGGELPVRAYLVGKVMRQAKPDDALQFVSPQEIADLWPLLEKYLGQTRAFWSWLLEEWEHRGVIRR
jgi:hypothetical protein